MTLNIKSIPVYFCLFVNTIEKLLLVVLKCHFGDTFLLLLKSKRLGYKLVKGWEGRQG